MENPTLEEVQQLIQAFYPFINTKIVTIPFLTETLGFTRPAWYNWRNGKYPMSWVHYDLLYAMLEHLTDASDKELEEIKARKKQFDFRTIAFTV